MEYQAIGAIDSNTALRVIAYNGITAAAAAAGQPISNPDGTTSNRGVAQGGFRAFPASNANGTELPGRPAATSGVKIEVPPGGTVTYFFAPTGSTPSTAPTYSVQRTAPASGAVVSFTEDLAGTDALFVTASTNGTGTGNPPPVYRFYQHV